MGASRKDSLAILTKHLADLRWSILLIKKQSEGARKQGLNRERREQMKEEVDRRWNGRDVRRKVMRGGAGQVGRAMRMEG